MCKHRTKKTAGLTEAAMEAKDIKYDLLRVLSRGPEEALWTSALPNAVNLWP